MDPKTTPKKSLSEVMENITNPEQTVTKDLSALESTADFKALPQAAKDKIRADNGVKDVEMDEIDAAIAKNKTEIIGAINLEPWQTSTTKVKIPILSKNVTP